MLKKLLPVLFFISFSSVFAQEIVRIDSIAIYEIGSHMNDHSKGILNHKGMITQLKPDSNGTFSINIFKQYTGFLSLDPSVKRKGLVSGATVLPGLAQYAYDETGIQVLKEKTFSLNTGLKFPFKYTFRQNTGADNKVQEKATEKILGSDEIGGDYTKLREMFPRAVNYSGDVYEHKYLNVSNDYKTLTYEKIPTEYLPFMGGYDVVNQGPSQKKTFPMNTNAKWSNAFMRGMRVFYLAPPVDDKVPVMLMDTTGKETRQDEFSILKGMEVVNSTGVSHELKDMWITNEGATIRKGMDFLLSTAATDRKKGNDYTLVRIDENGKVLYNHPFKMDFEDYMYDKSEIYSNENETVLTITLRKGLKFVMYYVKVKPEGVIYTSRFKIKLSLDTFTPKERKGQMGIKMASPKLITLADGENMIWGYGLDPNKSDQLSSYGGILIDKDGFEKASYYAKAMVPPTANFSRPPMTHFTLSDGRVMVIVNEPRDYSGNTFKQFSELDMELFKGYSVKDAELEPGKKNILYYSGKFVKAPVLDKVSSNLKFLDKVNDAVNKSGFSGLREAPQGPDKARFQMEPDPLGYVPVVFIIDTKKQDIRQYDFNRFGAYSLPGQSTLWFNRASGEMLAFMRTLPIPESKVKSTFKYPLNVYLKVIRLKL